jgi:hypothetical protein
MVNTGINELFAAGFGPQRHERFGASAERMPEWVLDTLYPQERRGKTRSASSAVVMPEVAQTFAWTPLSGFMHPGIITDTSEPFEDTAFRDLPTRRFTSESTSQSLWNQFGVRSSGMAHFAPLI